MTNWDETHTALNYVLAGLYPSSQEASRVATLADIPTIFIALGGKPVTDWHAVILEAIKRAKLLNLIRVALREYPEHPVLIQVEKGELSTIRGPSVGEQLDWKSELPIDTAEKIMGERSTLLPVSFLEVGMERARSVARVVLANREYGTGFLIADNLLVTNNHVLKHLEQARSAGIEFNYQQSAAGLSVEHVTLRLAPEKGFLTSAEDDWTIVRMSEDANADWGGIEVDPVAISKGDRVNIIQHPMGGPKQVALYHNVVTYADEKRVQYLTDTLPGSSGSPVFDSQWRLAALHHSGGWIEEPGAKEPVFRNEGIGLGCLLEGVAQLRK